MRSTLPTGCEAQLQPDTKNAVGPGTAEAIRCLIERRAGSGYWDGFQRYMVEPSEHSKEWRFGGTLGFGGKVHFNGRRLWVTAYPEDILRDSSMTKTLDAINAELAKVVSHDF